MTITYPDKRVFCTNPPTTAADLTYMADNNWSVVFGIVLSTGATANPAINLAARETEIDTCDDYGIPVWAELDTDMNRPYGGGGSAADRDAPESEWSSQMAVNVAIVEADDRIAGYQWEYGYVTGVNWLRSVTDKPLSIQWITSFIPTSTTFGETYFLKYGESAASYISLVDEIIWEWFAIDQGSACYNIFNYTTEHFPDVKLGVNHQVDDNTSVAYWGDTWNPSGYMHSYDTRKRRAIEYLNETKTQIGKPLDVLSPSWEGLGTDLINQLKFHEALNVFKPGTKRVYDTSHDGITPYYMHAAECAYEVTTDTFNNTGNEILVLKNVDYAGSHTFAVTVSGYVDHVDYSLTIDADKCAYIGPFAPLKFGSRPSIEYDDTNLDVTILKAVPV